MTATILELDAHEQPSAEMRAKWKALAKADETDVLLTVDEVEEGKRTSEFQVAGFIPAERLEHAFSQLCKDTSLARPQAKPIYHHPLMPGLLIIPSLIPPEMQTVLLRHVVHRHLGNPRHTTNMHLHFNIPYPAGDADEDVSFFSYTPESDVKFEPKDSSVHQALSVKQVLERKLHWLTLGGQYDWTNRAYPADAECGPSFPADMAGFVETLFPETRAQAAIVNFYSPGDHMMMHRDVSEQTDRGLVSLSLGCDGLFMIAPRDPGNMSEADKAAAGDKEYLVLRQRSGDAIYMTNEARFAWHGVPKVLKGTCPEYLAEWPAEHGKYEGWKGWMRNKRININIRQMTE